MKARRYTEDQTIAEWLAKHPLEVLDEYEIEEN